MKTKVILVIAFLTLLLATNLATGLFTARYTQIYLDWRWQGYIETVSGPIYREAGFTEGYYQGFYDLCFHMLLPEAKYKCLGYSVEGFNVEAHRAPAQPGWNWQVVKNGGFH